MVDELAVQPDFLLDCQTAKWFKNLASYVPPQSVFDRIGSLNASSSSAPLFTNPFYVQQIKNAGEYQINLDRFEINVNALPIVNGSRLTPVEFLNYIRRNLNNFVDNSITTFQPYYDPNDNINDATRWNSNYPTGSILHLNISGDNGSVIVSSNLPNQWTVSTLRTPLDGAHPVSGNRTWGYDQRSDGSYVFYVSGADRLTTDGRELFQYITGIPFFLIVTASSFIWGLNNYIFLFLLYHKAKRKILLLSFLSIGCSLIVNTLMVKNFLITGDAFAGLINTVIFGVMVVIITAKIMAAKHGDNALSKKKLVTNT